MLQRVFFLVAGVLFGFVLVKSGVGNYDVIHKMFMFQEFHMYGLLGVAVGTAFIVVQILKRMKFKALLTGQTPDMSIEKPTKAHVIGGLLSGFGWALTGACPGPALAQVGFGTLAGIFTVIGIFGGVYVYGRGEST
ncbi:MAG: YeeE/YedE family protein [Spirochaetia bacterium]|nr:YeeE/YedE family protein [Spirochaetia bacterium]